MLLWRRATLEGLLILMSRRGVVGLQAGGARRDGILEANFSGRRCPIPTPL